MFTCTRQTRADVLSRVHALGPTDWHWHRANGMASRLHHLERVFSMIRHAWMRLSFWEVGVVSDSVKYANVKIQ